MIINNIETSDISVVLQGPIDKVYTSLCVESIRKYLPKAEIIISTWEGSDVDSLYYDKVIFNKDPGCSYDDPDFKRAFNINRWIVSSKNGVKAAKNKYVLKGRTDMALLGTNFLNYFGGFNKRDDNFKLAKSKIIIPSPYTLKYLGDGKKYPIIQTPFHVSDWWCFGYREDIEAFVDCPMIGDLRSFARYYEERPYLITDDARWWMKDWFRKMAPEQYIGLCYAKKKFPDIDIADFLTIVNFDIDFAEKFLINNFIVLDPTDYEIILSKYEKFSKSIYILRSFLWKGMYRHNVYVKAYKKYCDPKQRIKIDVLNIKWKLNSLKNVFCAAINRFKHIIRNRINALKMKIYNYVYSRPNLFLTYYTYRHVIKGKAVYDRIKKEFANDKPIKICPFRGTGDSYIIGNYISSKHMENVYNFTVPRNINKLILSLYNINNVIVLSEKDNIELQHYVKVMQPHDAQIYHYQPSVMHSSVSMNIAGFKNINFADYYDYLVFGEKQPIPYAPIKSSNDIKEYINKYDVKFGKSALIAPYSDSIASLSISEWEYVVEKLIKKGYKVFTNCGGDNEKPIKGSIAAYVPLDLIGEFAENCGLFISVRSGICDIISMNNCKKIILHPKFHKYKYGRYKDFFTMTSARSINTIEFEYKKHRNKAVIDQIILLV